LNGDIIKLAEPSYTDQVIQTHGNIVIHIVTYIVTHVETK
jgi:hypothetical protein